jgi:hypothetical protein
MRKTKVIFTVFHKVTSLFLILTLAWLTVSTPFVCSFQEQMAKQHKLIDTKTPVNSTEENPLTNTPEEKAPTTNTASEEYIHEAHIAHPLISEISLLHFIEDSDIYNAFHGELLVPPPNQI